MNQDRMQVLLGKGYAKAAAKIGAPFDVFRPAGAASPLAAGNKVSTLAAIFTPHNAASFSFKRPSDYTSPLFHGLFDTRVTHVFDYLVHATQGTFFIASMDPIQPTLCVQCNVTVSLSRPVGATSVGLNPYGGSVPETEVAVMTSWPASLLDQGKGRAKQFGDLPGDVGTGVWELLLPLVPGVLVRDADIAVDNLGRRYILGSCELQDYGWRCKAVQKVT